MPASNSKIFFMEDSCGCVITDDFRCQVNCNCNVSDGDSEYDSVNDLDSEDIAENSADAVKITLDEINNDSADELLTYCARRKHFQCFKDKLLQKLLPS